MSKFSYFLMNAFFSAFIGAAVEIVFTLVTGGDSIYIRDLMESMAVGAVIGTISMVYISYFVLPRKPMESPVPMYLTNFLVVAVMFGLGIAYSFLRTGHFNGIAKWFTGFLVAEILSFFLTMVWYKNMMVLNQQLAKKKESLPE